MAETSSPSSPAKPSPAQRSTSFSDFQSPHEASVDRLVQALDRAYHRPGLLIWRSFLQGFWTAIGATVGTILLFVLIGYIVHTQGGLQLFTPVLEKVQETIVQSQAKTINNLLQSSPGTAQTAPGPVAPTPSFNPKTQP